MTTTQESEDPSAQYQNVGAHLGRRGSDATKISNTSPPVAETTTLNPQIPKRKDSLPYKKSGLPVPAQSKLPHNLHRKQLSIDSQIIKSAETETGKAVSLLFVIIMIVPHISCRRVRSSQTEAGSYS